MSDVIDIDKRRGPRLLLNKDDTVRKCLRNVVELLSKHADWDGVLAYDEFAMTILKRKPPPLPNGTTGPWSDVDSALASCWLIETHGINVSSVMVAEAVNVVAHGATFHPVREYLSTLEWDGIERINSWLIDHAGAHNGEYARTVGRLFLIGAVARVMEPGCKVDTVLILQGPQGVLKSTLFRVLASDDWFLDDHIDFSNKDGLMALQGRWIIEMAELESLRKAESEQAKLFFSKQSDKFRPPYGRSFVDRPRHCTFVGTANSSEFLKDTTGNRRFWPLSVTEIKLEELRAVRDQLWAEAFSAYKCKERWWLDAHADAKVIALAAEEADRRQSHHPWDDLIEQYLESTVLGDFVPTAEILEKALELPKDKQSTESARRVAEKMSRLKWVYGRPRRGGTRKVRGYWRPGSHEALAEIARRGG